MIETVKKWQGCAVCGYSLSHRRADDSWFHARVDMQDHVVVPVDMDQLSYNSKCDFCDQEDPGWIILARTFELPELDSRSIGPWAACEVCKPLVEKRYWSRLVSRVCDVGGPASRHSKRSILLDLWAKLERHIYGVIPAAEWRERHADFWEMPVD